MLQITTTAVAILILLQTPAFSDSVYVWTDEKGVKHYSNTGPSEIIEGYQKEDEVPSESASASSTRAVPAEAPAAAETRTDSAPGATAAEGDSTDPEAEYLDATRINLDLFPQEQGYLVQREKSIIAALQQELEQTGVSRQDVIKRERKRLLFAVNTLEQAPLEKFGSQKNKRRQVGYYKYRIDELLNNSDAYFQYPQTDAD